MNNEIQNEIISVRHRMRVRAELEDARQELKGREVAYLHLEAQLEELLDELENKGSRYPLLQRVEPLDEADDGIEEIPARAARGKRR